MLGLVGGEVFEEFDGGFFMWCCFYYVVVGNVDVGIGCCLIGLDDFDFFYYFLFFWFG